jgi:hypothetical protein
VRRRQNACVPLQEMKADQFSRLMATLHANCGVPQHCLARGVHHCICSVAHAMQRMLRFALPSNRRRVHAVTHSPHHPHFTIFLPEYSRYTLFLGDARRTASRCFDTSFAASNTKFNRADSRGKTHANIRILEQMPQALRFQSLNTRRWLAVCFRPRASIDRRCP